MIISHTHKFIFIKAHKVAGTSVEHSLFQHCGPDDIVTPASNYNPDVDEDPYEQTGQNYTGFTDHEMPQSVKRKIDTGIWDEYQKIVCVRNPWDMLVSFFRWWSREPSKPSDMPRFFDAFLRWHFRL